MISVLEIIQLAYQIPSMILMILSVYVIITEIKNKNAHLNTQFYSIIVCKLSNEIIYNINVFIFVVLPKWGFYNNFLKNHDWTATLYYVLETQQTTFMFLITLLVSINRYVAVKYPLLYKYYFLKSKIVIILLSFIILSTIIGLGNIFFNAKYMKNNLFDYIIPSFKSENAFYYQIFYQIFLFGIISIATCTFNVIAILTLKKYNQIGNKYKKELNYTIYSIFIFITLFLVEILYVCNIIAIKYDIISFIYTIYFFYDVALDITSFGDFYFLIYSS
uniref:Serpentine receptor class gamma n=1 Tax=Strongyloides papillosus TaxID=174720 RepID=A0A0N5B4B5_STREA